MDELSMVSLLHKDAEDEDKICPVKSQKLGTLLVAGYDCEHSLAEDDDAISTPSSAQKLRAPREL